MSALASVDAADWLPGMKVKCLKGVSDKARGRVSDPHSGLKVGEARNPEYPVAGEIYTLRNINRLSSDKALILLEEVRNDHLGEFVLMLEPGFDAKYFEAVPHLPSGAAACSADSPAGSTSSPIPSGTNHESDGPKSRPGDAVASLTQQSSSPRQERPSAEERSSDRSGGQFGDAPKPAHIQRAVGGADITMKHEGIQS